VRWCRMDGKAMIPGITTAIHVIAIMDALHAQRWLV